ncbi:MAG: DUF1559 domain-containing protein [Pirellulales bacterium]|nr:DUF1559 domain-containing protein [Pirellulales bacterium]
MIHSLPANRCSRPVTRGFTLVELLVVISIIGILVSMLLPAVQQARESGNRVQCKNNLRNLGTGAKLHETAQKFYPTGGWGWGWAGDADRGFTRKQPGSWFYNILPYIEEPALHDLGKGVVNQTLKHQQHAKRAATPVAVFNCPTRRRALTWAMPNPRYVNMDNNLIRNGIARTDYAANGGDVAFAGIPEFGPQANALTFTNAQWKPLETAGNNYSRDHNTTGIVSIRSEWTSSAIKDGQSKTYLAGERYIDAALYESGQASDDDQGWDVAYDWDNIRGTQNPPQFDVNANNGGGADFFGSAHTTVFNMVMCDGSVQTLSYDVNRFVHRVLGHRADGQMFMGTLYETSSVLGQ